MKVIIVQAAGLLVFLLATLLLILRVAKNTSKGPAETASRINYVLFWLCLVLPNAVALVRPGILNYDRILGANSLSFRPLLYVLGVFLVLSGVWVIFTAIKQLLKAGDASVIFLHTKSVITEGLFKYSRHPMALGCYMLCIGLAMMVGSSTVLFGLVFILIPAHMFNLKYFEERELANRFGMEYLEYKRQVPFLIPVECACCCSCSSTCCVK